MVPQVSGDRPCDEREVVPPLVEGVGLLVEELLPRGVDEIRRKAGLRDLGIALDREGQTVRPGTGTNRHQQVVEMPLGSRALGSDSFDDASGRFERAAPVQEERENVGHDLVLEQESAAGCLLRRTRPLPHVVFRPVTTGQSSGCANSTNPNEHRERAPK